MNKKFAILSLSLLAAATSHGATSTAGTLLAHDAAPQTANNDNGKSTNVAQQQAATGQIIGHVADADGMPVARAAVKVGDRVVAVTDKDGNFSVRRLPAGTRYLTISYIGMRTAKVSVSSTMNVQMEWDNANLDEVMVVAYGTAKKSSLTGSAATIKADDIAKVQASNPVEGLKGRISGVQIYNPSGSPDGGTPSIRIRGISSINAGNDPLIIVDGAPYPGDLSSINAQDIATFSVLKDAASAALYGARGANGVIIITTKRAQAGGGARITFEAKWGVNQVAQQRYSTITTPEAYYEAFHKALGNEMRYQNLNASGDYQLGTETAAYTYSNENLEDRLKYMVYNTPEGENLILPDGSFNPHATLGRVVEGTDAEGKPFSYLLRPDNWYDLAYSPALREEYNVTVSKANDNSNIFFSTGYLNNRGVLANTSFSRLSSRLKAEWEAKPWLQLNANLSYSHAKTHSVVGQGDADDSGSVFAFVNNIAPIYPAFLRDAQGNQLVDRNGYTIADFGSTKYLPFERPYMALSNPLLSNVLDYNGKRSHLLTANFGTELRLGYDLKFVTNNTLFYTNTRESSLVNPYYGSNAESSKGEVSALNTENVRTNFQQLLNYSRHFGQHNVEALIGHEYYNSKSYELSGSRSNIPNNKNHELAAGIVNGTPNSVARDYNTEGWFARANYSLADRYFASASFRRDASSRFHPNHRWGNFWSISGAWLITKEDFFKVNWVDELKLKVSYGEQGNDGIDNFLYTNTYSVKNANGHLALVPSQLGNEPISWEKNGNFNVGVEFSLLKGRLSGSVEYFDRSTHDMLADYNLPRSNSFSSYKANLGNMSNRGVELELNAELIRTRQFSWSVGLNLTHYRNEITSIPELKRQKVYDGHAGYENGSYFYGEGVPMWTRYVKRSAGVDPRSGELTYYVWANRYDLSRPKYQTDAAGNNILDASGHPIQLRDRWGELVYEDAQVPQVDANGNVRRDAQGNAILGTVADRLTKTTQASEASYFLGKSPHPDLYGGFNTRLAYAGFDLAIDFSFQLGGHLLDTDYADLVYGFNASSDGQQVHTDALNKSWTPERRTATLPRLQAGTELDYNHTVNTDLFYTSASFLSLNNINLGYTLPATFLRNLTKGQLQSVRFFVSADNIVYWSARKGFDPRQSITQSHSTQYAPVRTISGGLSITL